MDFKQEKRELHSELQQNQFMNLDKQEELNKSNLNDSLENIREQKQKSMLDDFEVVEKEQSELVIKGLVNAQRKENDRIQLPGASEITLDQFKDLYKVLEENRDEADKSHTYLPMVTACWRVINEWNTQGGAVTKQNIATLKSTAKNYLDKHSGYTFTFRGRRRKKIAQDIFDRAVAAEKDLQLGRELDSKVTEKVDIMKILEEHPEEQKMVDGHIDVDEEEILNKYDTVTKQRMENEENVKLINTYTTNQQVRELPIGDLYKLGMAYSSMKEVIPEFRDMINSLGDIMKELVIPSSVGLIKDKTINYRRMTDYLVDKVTEIRVKAMVCIDNLKDKNSIMQKDNEVINGFIVKLVSSDLFNMIRAEVLTSRSNNAFDYSRIRESVDMIGQAAKLINVEDEDEKLALIRKDVKKNQEDYEKLIHAEVNKDLFDINLKYAQNACDVKLDSNEEAKQSKALRLHKEISWKKEEEINRILRLSGITKEKCSAEVRNEFLNLIVPIINSAWTDEVGRFDFMIKKAHTNPQYVNSHFNSPEDYEDNLKDFIEFYRDLDNVSLIQKMDDVGILAEEFEKPDEKLSVDKGKVSSATEKDKLTKKREKELKTRMRYINSLLGDYRAKSDQSLDAMLRVYRENRYNKSFLGVL